MPRHIIACLALCALVTGCFHNANSPELNVNPVEYSFKEEIARERIKALLSSNGEINEEYWYDGTAYHIVGYLLHIDHDDEKAWKALRIMFERIDGEVAQGGLEQDIVYLLDTSTLPRNFWFERLVASKAYTYSDSYASLMKHEIESCRQKLEHWQQVYNYRKREEGKNPMGTSDIRGSGAGVKESLQEVKKWQKMAKHFEQRLSSVNSD